MKRLIFRLSSLGDLVLSQSILEPPYAGETHWVVAKEFESLIAGHPAVAKVWAYDRKESRGLGAWLRFVRALRAEGYTEVLDAHSTLRTRIARILFRLESPKTKWRKISKERLRRFGYVVAKRFWPRAWRPTHLSRRCAKLAAGYGNERPNLRWLVGSMARAESGKESRVALIPGSAWPGKEWPTKRYLEWTGEFRSRHPDTRFLVLGAARDRAAIDLLRELRQAGVSVEDGVGKYTLSGVAGELARSVFAVGGDTGLLHLAEAVGTPVVTLFGPTRSDFGFGPQDERSAAVETTLWCSPCSKDGRLCFRTARRFACLVEMDSRRATVAAEKIFSENEGNVGAGDSGVSTASDARAGTSRGTKP